MSTSVSTFYFPCRTLGGLQGGTSESFGFFIFNFLFLHLYCQARLTGFLSKAGLGVWMETWVQKLYP